MIQFALYIHKLTFKVMAKKTDIKEDALFKTKDGRIGKAYAVTQRKIDEGVVDLSFEGPGNVFTGPLPSGLFYVKNLKLVKS